MKRKSITSTGEKDKLNPMSDTRNYAAGKEGEDILYPEDEDEETEEEPVPNDMEPDDEDDNEKYAEEDDD